MNSLIRLVIAIFIIPIFIQSCSKVPLTGRTQLNIVPESQVITMASSSYTDFLKSNQRSSDRRNTQLVNKVGNDIAAAVTRYFKEHSLMDRLEGYKWEFNLVENKTPNAWCMPGGKVVVYSGILPYTRDENGLAVVMSHEIAHAVARHGNERLSQGLIAQFGGIALNELIRDKSEEAKSIFNTAYGVGAQVGVMLPFSREHELEADKLGLIFMAMAGYDPREAVGFWERMAQKSGGSPPEFLSTHPSDATRIRKIKAALPDAMKYARK
jgi:predicted Zn-dependent protease